jgi:hypothetical protein
MPSSSFRRYLKLLRNRLNKGNNAYDEGRSRTRPKPKSSRPHFKPIAKYHIWSANSRAQNTNESEQAAEHRSNERLLARSTIAIAALTFILACVGAASALFSAFQWRAITGQLDEMTAEQRPWIKIESISIDAIKFANDTFTAGVKYTIYNAGRKPARGKIVAKIFAAGNDIIKAIAQNGLSDVCKESNYGVDNIYLSNSDTGIIFSDTRERALLSTALLNILTTANSLLEGSR